MSDPKDLLALSLIKTIDELKAELAEARARCVRFGDEIHRLSAHSEGYKSDVRRLVRERTTLRAAVGEAVGYLAMTDLYPAQVAYVRNILTPKKKEDGE